MQALLGGNKEGLWRMGRWGKVKVCTRAMKGVWAFGGGRKASHKA